MPLVSYIIPTLNEARNIDLLLTQIFDVSRRNDIDFEVIFSDGGSKDQTVEEIKRWQDRGNVRVIENPHKTGLSDAVIIASKSARGVFSIVMDADLSHPVSVLPELLYHLSSGDYDMVIGSRYVKGGDTPDWPVTRKISSILATLPARIFTDVKDPLAGFIGVRTERMASLGKDVLGFKIGLELLATAEPAMKVKEVPIIFRDRCYGDSKMTGSVILDYVRQLLILAGINILPCKLSYLMTLLTTLFVSDSLLNYFLINRGVPFVSASTISFLFAAGIALVGWLIIEKKEDSITFGEGQKKFHAMFFLLNLALILFLRLGFTGMISAGGGVSQVAILSLSAISSLLLYVSTVVFSFSAGMKRVGKFLSARIYGIGLLVYLLCSQLIAIFSTSATGYEIQFLQKITEATVPSSHEIIFLRLVCWSCWLASAVFIFNFTKDICNRAAAFTSVFLFALLPFSFASGIYAAKETINLLLWCGLINFSFRAFILNSKIALLSFTATAWFSLYFDSGAGFILAGIAGYLILSMFAGTIVEKKNILYSWGSIVLVGFVVIFSSSPGTSTMSATANWLEVVSGMNINSAIFASLLFVTPTVLLGEGGNLLRRLSCSISFKQSEVAKQLKDGWFSGVVFFISLVVALLTSYVTGKLRYEIVLCWVALLPVLADQITLRLRKDINEHPIMNYLWIVTIPVLVFLYYLRLYIFTT